MTKHMNIVARVLVLVTATLVAACDETGSEARIGALPDGGEEVLGDAEQPLDGDGGVVDAAALPPQARTYLFEGTYRCIVTGNVTRQRGDISAGTTVVDAPLTLTVTGASWTASVSGFQEGDIQTAILAAGYYDGLYRSETVSGVLPAADVQLSAQLSQDADAPDITLYAQYRYANGDYDKYSVRGDCSR